MPRPQFRPKHSYALLLALLGTGSFGLFSGTELNLLLKGYALLLLLMGGWALIYFGVYLKDLRKHHRSH